MLGKPLPCPSRPHPAAERADHAVRLAEAISALVDAKADARGCHVAFVLLQKVVTPSLDFDMRVTPPSELTQQRAQVHDAVAGTLQHIMASQEICSDTLAVLSLPADMGGAALRMPDRQAAGSAARWASQEEALPVAQGIAQQLGILGDWTQ